MSARSSLAFLTLVVCATCGWAETPPSPGRRLAYPPPARNLAAPVAAAVGRLTAANARPVADEALKPADVYARLLPRAAVLDGASLKKGARLGGRPFAFLTVPEAFEGKTLLQAFTDIGYSADSVLADQIGREMVVVVFRYPEGFTRSEVRDGRLPEDVSRQVLVPTWENTFVLLERLATNAAIADKPVSADRLTLATERERHFLLGFPAAGRERVRKVPYAPLRETGGADWEYRSLLERKLGLSEHFTGTGFTRPAIGPPKGERRGLPEFVGPNLTLESFPDLAVVDFGAFRVSE